MTGSAPFAIADPVSGPAPLLIAPAASDATRENVEELAQLIEQMSGRRPDITTHTEQVRALCVGTAAEFPDAPRVGELHGENPEAFVLHTNADRLYIVGNSDVGAQQGIFTLLQQLGCRWFFPHEAWTVIPEQRRLHIDVSRVGGLRLPLYLVRLRVAYRQAACRPAGLVPTQQTAWLVQHRHRTCLRPARPA